MRRTKILKNRNRRVHNQDVGMPQQSTSVQQQPDGVVKVDESESQIVPDNPQGEQLEPIAAAQPAKEPASGEDYQKRLARLQQWESDLTAGQQALDEYRAMLETREQKVRERDAGYANERANLDRELNEKRTEWESTKTTEIENLQSELTRLRSQLLNNLKKELAIFREQQFAGVTRDVEAERDRIIQAAHTEADRIRAAISQERKDWDNLLDNQRKEQQKQNSANEKRAGEISAKEDFLWGREQELNARERALENLNDQRERSIEQQVAARQASFDTEERSLRAELERLRESLRSQTMLLGEFDQLKRQLGGEDPAKVHRDLDAKTDEIRRLRSEISKPSDELKARFEQQEAEIKRLKGLIQNLQEKLSNGEAEVQAAMVTGFENAELRQKCELVSKDLERMTAAYNQIDAELKRLRKAYERPEEIVARYQEIEKPRIAAGKITQPDKDQDIDELTWLNNILSECRTYGIHFPHRIMWAFHTALKTADWSPITILAGVSGTGKSELPHLYSHFGGLMFEPLSVQPNWDSQEYMLGFFNSIDNKFDAQPVLNFLAQSQLSANMSFEKRLEKWRRMSKKSLGLTDEDLEKLREDNYPGLYSCLNMVLLDEMNLAHPELYFAEFLSKLESRRNKSGKGIREDAICLDVKIGAGQPYYKLPLGRNVFWVGTMNQDETTKSLSDKVLDRSTIIYFPRPRTLVSRNELTPLNDDDESRGRALGKSHSALHRSIFLDKWVVRKIQFDQDEKISTARIAPFKAFVEELNEALGFVGRAIGHRVWQSIEYYIANYPDVRKAVRENDEAALKKWMHIAFEDQLVQKVMPKLRGIDTRGESKEKCLNPIGALLRKGVEKQPFNLDEDFELAQKLGYGQFMWQTANYLNEDEGKRTHEVQSVNVESSEDDASCDDSKKTASPDSEKLPPPEWYRKGDEQRVLRWNRLTVEQRNKMIETHKRRPQQ